MVLGLPVHCLGKPLIVWDKLRKTLNVWGYCAGSGFDDQLLLVSTSQKMDILLLRVASAGKSMGAGRGTSVVLLLQQCSPRSPLTAETPLPVPQGREMQRLPHLFVCFSSTTAECKAVVLSPSWEGEGHIPQKILSSFSTQTRAMETAISSKSHPHLKSAQMRHTDWEGCHTTGG